jgi:hypothetical protein
MMINNIIVITFSMLQSLGGSISSRDPIFNMFSKFLLAQFVHCLVFIDLHKVWTRCFHWLQFGCLNVAWWFWVCLQIKSFSCFWNLWFLTSSPHNLLLSNLIYLIFYVFTQYFFCSITSPNSWMGLTIITMLFLELDTFEFLLPHSIYLLFYSLKWHHAFIMISIN